ncbi:sushi domain-containing protein 4 isoform X2 [Denticeps clupeoides]|uniref:sushi domain-containing protein 4 isoform X2 n=1 Tax=Denticeps clupeoides TaxID=299321 RepID=UPI0010A5760D|nr:sushi domain-containing protein 4 isoform X2 [Denticeps clupeoides]
MCRHVSGILLALAALLSFHEGFAASDLTAVGQSCEDPGFPEHGNRTPVLGIFFEKAVARFFCMEGFRLQGSALIVCTRFQNGSMGWRPSLKPLCLQEDCLPPYIEDASVVNKTYKPGDNLVISCHEGFQIRYPDVETMVSVCQDDGTWDNQPICQGCLRPLMPPHSYMNLSETEFSVPVGTVVFFQCFPGYNLEGAEFLECMYDLIWSTVPPQCLEVEVCPLPPALEHGDYICHPELCGRYTHGTVVEFYCDSGYSLANDYQYITCQYGQWFPHVHFYCVKTDTSWPGIPDSLLTTWKVVASTAVGGLLALFIVIMVKVFQFKCTTHWSLSSQRRDPRDHNILVVDGVPVHLPTYEEAVNSTDFNPPSVPTPTGMGNTWNGEEQSPPAYPGYSIAQAGAPLDTSECETTESLSVTSEGVQSMQPSLSDADRANIITSIEETASTSPSIDIADAIPLVEDGPEHY